MLLELMHSWRLALREGVFAETKEGICRNKEKKASFKNSRRARVKVPHSKQDKRVHGAASPKSVANKEGEEGGRLSCLLYGT